MTEEKLDLKQIATLPSLFRARVAQTPDKIAYWQFDVANNSWQSTTWRAIASEVARWQAAMLRDGLQRGDRVGIMLRNSREWVVFDQAALGLGLVTVPLYLDDRPDNVAYIVRDAGIRLLLVEGRRQWQRLQQVGGDLQEVVRIVSVRTIEEEDAPRDPRLESLADWIFGLHGALAAEEGAAQDLATIVYTSGTTGRPKGVMLSHDNILFNVAGANSCAELGGSDRFLSFLPLSHMLERTGGYYLPMLVAAEVSFARSVNQLAEDLQTQRPTVLISVPRIYERFHARILQNLRKQPAFKQRMFRTAVQIGWQRFLHEQGRGGWRPGFVLWPLLKKKVADKLLGLLGGRLRFAICGGAAMPPEIAREFIGLGLTLLQGYGLTETSPVISVNRPEDNIPESIGTVLPGIEVMIGANDELLSRSRCVMLGYWNNPTATAATIDADGWLHTGDQARIDAAGHLHITGRIKDIIVLGNGEKVPPADMEMAIALDPLFEQVMLLGEGRAYLAALIVLNPEEWKALSEMLGVNAADPESLQHKFVQKAVLARVNDSIRAFPGFAQVRRVHIALDPWTIEAGLITPTMKMKRAQIVKRFSHEIDELFGDGA
ncbi:MAG: AMP-dependent synthetase/ligase [Thiotrichales bacterium]